MEKIANYKFPLNVHIATLFIGLILLMAIVLGWFNYQQNSRVLLSATEKLYGQIAGELGAGLQAIYRPIVGMVDVLADSDIMAARAARGAVSRLRVGRLLHREVAADARDARAFFRSRRCQPDGRQHGGG